MKIELQYADGASYAAYIPEEAFANVAACLLDDVSATVTGHLPEKAEEVTT